MLRQPRIPKIVIKHRKLAAGFTLIELVVTLIVLTIALTLFLSNTAFAQETRSEGVKENDLRLAPGKLLVEGRNSTPSGPQGLLTYRVEEIVLRQPVAIRHFGKTVTVAAAIRLTITGKSVWTANVIWIDDARLNGIWSHGPGKIGVLIYDRSVLRDGALISVQDEKGLHILPEPLRLPESLKTGTEPTVEEGNAIVSIHTALRITGSVRQPLIQIEMKTDRPFPVRNAALQLQIGKQFFLNELGGDSSGHFLTVSLSPQAFAELKDGAEVLAGFTFDRSGARGDEIWYFGRLNKSMLDK